MMTHTHDAKVLHGRFPEHAMYKILKHCPSCGMAILMVEVVGGDDGHWGSPGMVIRKRCGCVRNEISIDLKRDGLRRIKDKVDVWLKKQNADR